MHLPLLALLACAPARVSNGGPLSFDSGGGSADGGSGDGGSADGGGAPDSPDGTITDVSIAVSPLTSTILVVTWTLTQDADETWVRYRFDGQDHDSPHKARAAGTWTEVLLGVPADMPVQAVVQADFGDNTSQSGTLEGETGSLPSNLRVPDLVFYDPDLASPEPYALTAVDVGNYNFYGPFYVLILDRQGRVVWYESVDDSRMSWQPRASRDGSHLLYEASTYYVYDANVQPSIKALTLDKRQEDETFIAGFGLAWSELPDGGFVFDYAETGYKYHVETLSPDGVRTRVWSCYPWMSQYDRSYWACADNAIVYQESTNTILYSMFQTSTVVQIDLDSGEMIRQMGQVPDGWSFDPPESVFTLQHYPNWTADGTIIASTHVQGTSGVQMVREFSLDDASQTLHQLWSYQEPEGVYAEYAGGAQKLANGNAMVTVGTDGTVLEVIHDGQIAWQLDWHGHLVGNVTPLSELYPLNQGW